MWKWGFPKREILRQRDLNTNINWTSPYVWTKQILKNEEINQLQNPRVAVLGTPLFWEVKHCVTVERVFCLLVSEVFVSHHQVFPIKALVSCDFLAFYFFLINISGSFYHASCIKVKQENSSNCKNLPCHLQERWFLVSKSVYQLQDARKHISIQNLWVWYQMTLVDGVVVKLHVLWKLNCVYFDFPRISNFTLPFLMLLYTSIIAFVHVWPQMLNMILQYKS